MLCNAKDAFSLRVMSAQPRFANKKDGEAEMAKIYDIKTRIGDSVRIDKNRTLAHHLRQQHRMLGADQCKDGAPG